MALNTISSACSRFFSFPPDLFPSFSILVSASGGWLVWILSAVLCAFWLLVGCEQWWMVPGYQGREKSDIGVLIPSCPSVWGLLTKDDSSWDRIFPANSLLPSSYNYCLHSSVSIWDTRDVPLFLVFPYTPTSQNSPFVINKPSLNSPNLSLPLFSVGISLIKCWWLLNV